MKLILIVSLLCPWLASASSAKSLNGQSAPFAVPALGYAVDALTPAIDAQTMTIHHDKHHQAYVDKLNAALGAGEKLTLLEILKSAKGRPAAVRNNAGGHWNHSFFWTIMSPDAKKTKMSADLRKRLASSFGGVDEFKAQFERAGQDLFGSGWVWLIAGDGGKLQIVTTTNQDNPLMDAVEQRGRPILGVDVWEHAYYLKYQNKRADYLKAFWSIVNWDQVSAYLAE